MEEEGVIESDSAVASEPVIAPEPVIASEPVIAPEPVIESEPVIAPEPVIASEPVIAPNPVITPEPLVKTTATPYINTDSNKIDYVGALEGFIIVILICMIALGLAKRIGR
jgi:UDP-3-O-[3-hydroxymyristoyl] glucosamine N-acyltransferase